MPNKRSVRNDHVIAFCFRSLFLASVALLCTAACSSPPAARMVPDLSPVSDNPKVEKTYKTGLDLFAAGNLSGAETVFQSVVTEHSSDPLSHYATLYLGRIALRRGNHHEAIDLLCPLVNIEEATAFTDHASLYCGRALFESGAYAESISTLSPLSGRFPSKEDHLLILDTLWRASEGKGDFEAEILWIEQYLISIPDVKGEQDAQTALNSCVPKLQEPKKIELLISRLQETGAVWQFLCAQLAYRYYELEKFDDATRVVEALKGKGVLSSPHSFAAKIAEVIQLVDVRNQVDMGTIGLILPLTGRTRLIGDAALKGAMLGVKQTGSGSRQAPLSVVIKDTVDSPAKAADAVTQLVNEDRVAAIIGPMDGEASVAAAARAQQLGVPIILLTSWDGVARTGSYVFRRFSSNSGEVTALVETISQLSSQRVAALFPDNSYGKSMLQELQLNLTKRNLRVVAEVSFVPDQSDFTEAVKLLAKSKFDVLFLPLTATQLALAAPALAAAGIWPGQIAGTKDGQQVIWLVPSVGFSVQLVNRAGRYLQGARFVVPYHPAMSSASARFEQLFSSQYNAAPTVFSGFAYDAVTLIAAGIREGARNRLALKDRIRETSRRVDVLSRLVMPLLGFDEQGEAGGVPRVMSLHGETLEPFP